MQSYHPKIINRTVTELSSYAKKVLATMFATYSQVIVKSEFQSGFSSSKVFLVRPVRQDGAELPAVIKIDLAARIQREWEAYQQCIQNRLPNVAEIHGDPIYPAGSLWGGLWYPLVGAGTFEIESLNQYLRQANIEDIRHTLEARLFKSLGVLWSQTQTVQPDLHLQTHYDSFLPMNLVIELVGLPTDSQAQWLHPNNVSILTLKSGDFVQVAGFQVVKVLGETQKLSLDLPPDSLAAYRIQVFPVSNSTAYEVGDIIEQPLIGIVRQTREDLLREQVRAALGQELDLTTVSLTLPNNRTLPNPLHALPDILNHSLDAYVSFIHGDLNLENVLVETESRTAYLIDFAKSRKDHSLRDLFHLEMSVVTQLVSAGLRANSLTAEAICSFYEQLHCAVLHPGQISAPQGLEKPFSILLMIRQTAQRYLFTPEDWSEYFYGLAIYLLGSLRYPNLDEVPGAKAVAFWGTAVTLKLLQSAPPCQPQQAQASSSQQDNPKPTTQTHFYGPVTGPIHTGSGNINVSSLPKSKKAEQPQPKPRYEDIFSVYENGLNRMLAQVGPDHPRYSEVLVYQQRLTENISRARRFGDTNLRQADRAEIIDQLNELALATMGVSFNKLCQETAA
ncbi:MAG: phosphotransferase [Ardenticatenaceae bacterium]|nr:phosphotransferase [Ardenticatenaceae bacterium]